MFFEKVSERFHGPRFARGQIALFAEIGQYEPADDQSCVGLLGCRRAMEARDRLALAGLVALLVGTRLVWLVYNPESAAYWEEAQRWMTARQLLGGAVLPWIEFQADHYQGGSLVVAAVCAALLALFGDSLLVFKCGALVFSVATLCALFVCCRIGAGRTAACIAGLGFVAGPPVVAFWGLVPFGSHQESILFSAVGLLLLLRLFRGQRSPRDWFAFGCVGGLGVWFCYTAGLALVAFGLAWLIIESLPKRRQWLWLAAGMVCGLLPWLAYNATRGFVGLARIGHLLGAGNPINAWESQSVGVKLWSWLGRDLPFGLLFPFEDAGGGFAWLAAAFALPLVLAVAAACVGLWRRSARTQPLEMVWIVYIALFSAFYLASDFSVEPDQGAVAYRLFLPLAVFATCLGAVVAARALERPGPARWIAACAIAFHLLASAAGTLLLATRTPDDDQRFTADSGYFVHGLLMYRKYEEDLQRPLSYARALPSGKLRNLALVGIGLGLEFRFEKNGTAADLNARLVQLELPERTRVLTGIYSGIDFRRAALAQRSEAGRTSDRDRTIGERLDVLQQMVDVESDRIPDRFWPLGGNRRSPAPR